ncbi:hypothetical protein Adi01nite_56490 [Amorphoplanes digitatis]|nr:hypothetical protein Adi01nite_56490 [Actinoplanes digitatis]
MGPLACHAPPGVQIPSGPQTPLPAFALGADQKAVVEHSRIPESGDHAGLLSVGGHRAILVARRRQSRPVGAFLRGLRWPLMSCGQRADIAAHVDAALLRDDWHKVKRLTTRELNQA